MANEVVGRPIEQRALRLLLLVVWASRPSSRAGHVARHRYEAFGDQVTEEIDDPDWPLLRIARPGIDNVTSARIDEDEDVVQVTMYAERLRPASPAVLAKINELNYSLTLEKVTVDPTSGVVEVTAAAPRVGLTADTLTFLVDSVVVLR
ncbi:YbjN domain-containing protein [Paraconexibacter antarcticus]|uniref:YbjN domain-containing protein n=1 Tax=Paraconexibacter antarcticus TaxID=2949664 RepID=UPI003F58A894